MHLDVSPVSPSDAEGMEDGGSCDSSSSSSDAVAGTGGAGDSSALLSDAGGSPVAFFSYSSFMYLSVESRFTVLFVSMPIKSSAVALRDGGAKRKGTPKEDCRMDTCRSPSE